MVVKGSVYVGIITFISSFIIAFLIYVWNGRHSEVARRYYRCTAQEFDSFPHHCLLRDSIALDPQQSSKELYEFSKTVGFVLDNPPRLFSDDDNIKINRNLSLIKEEKGTSSSSAVLVPSVLAHGMGDSCFNEGMKSITSRVSDLTGSYAKCIPTADNLHDDTINGYFLNMDASIDIFATKVKNDPKLKDGFNAVGFSQGNNLIRGYIARYNNPPVKTFLSINGVNAGVGAVPYCMTPQSSYRKSSKICNALMEVASHRAYSTFAQQHSFQANYWRDPRKSQRENYRTYSQLAQLNNEGMAVNWTLNDNFAKTNRFVWVMAKNDRMVWPKEGEHWGAPNPNNPFNDILPMNQTQWYRDDLFGLRTADEAGKNFFESFVGDHLEFTLEDFEGWIKKYFFL